MELLVINGPNINLLGLREPEIYGKETYQDLVGQVKKLGDDRNIKIDFFQSNHEGSLVDKIQEAYGKYQGIIINPAAYTHTSLAILDALKAVGLPFVEVHISKVMERESFRQISYISEYAVKRIEGNGIMGYQEAVLALEKFIKEI